MIKTLALVAIIVTIVLFAWPASVALAKKFLTKEKKDEN